MVEQKKQEEKPELVARDGSVRVAPEVVIYTGSSTHRVITKEQWAAAGVTDMDNVVWERDMSQKGRPNPSLPRNKFTEKALEVLRRDSNFVVD